MFIIPQIHTCPVLFGSILQKIGNEHLYFMLIQHLHVPHNFYQPTLVYQRCVVTNDLFSLPMVQQPLVPQGLLNIKAS